METSNASLLSQLTSAALRLNDQQLTPLIRRPRIFQSAAVAQDNGKQMTSRHQTAQDQNGTASSSQAALQQQLITQERVNEDLLGQIADLQKALQERNEQVKELDSYAYTVAHGLKTPLSVITFASEMLMMAEAAGTPDPDAPELLDSINRMGHKMARIIEDLLSLTSRSRTAVAVDPLEMEPILEEVKQRLASAIKISGAEIVFASPVAEWPVALGNRQLVEEAWDNFLSNAIKYGGRPPRIELGAEQIEDNIEDNMVRFWIRDNGAGIPENTQKEIFKAFNQLHANLAYGHGLGLAITERMIHQLNGQVTITSTGIPGDGSTFSFTLPAA